MGNNTFGMLIISIQQLLTESSQIKAVSLYFYPSGKRNEYKGQVN